MMFFETKGEKLRAAAQDGNVTAVKKWLSKGANVNSRSVVNGYTALHEACSGGKAEVVRALLSFHADTKVQDNLGQTALHAACGLFGSTDAVRLLLDAGADIDARDSAGWTALHYASYNVNTDSVRLLLSRGADIEAKEKNGKTPLHTASVACVPGNTDSLRLLLESGANVEAADNFGWIALHHGYEHPARLRLLLDFGSKIDAVDKEGKTALMVAAHRHLKTAIAYHNYSNSVALLLSRGADHTIKDKDGKTALDHAREKAHLESVELLTNRQLTTPMSSARVSRSGLFGRTPRSA